MICANAITKARGERPVAPRALVLTCSAVEVFRPGKYTSTGLFLLHAGKVLDDPATRKLAARAADRLTEVGVAEHGGLRWSMDPKFPRRMPNFSHGTAGIAYFLARTSRRRSHSDVRGNHMMT